MRVYFPPLLKVLLNSLTIIEPAELPTKPISPSIFITTGLAMLVGFFLAAIGVYLLELLDQTINTPEEAARALDTNILGEIPKIDKEDNPLSFVNDQPFSPITDAFRSLRNNLEFINLGKEIKTLFITSSGINEGKSTIAMNLALSLAKSNKRVIIIDADFYQSNIKKQFKLKQNQAWEIIYNPVKILSANILYQFSMDNFTYYLQVEHR